MSYFEWDAEPQSTRSALIGAVFNTLSNLFGRIIVCDYSTKISVFY